MASATFTPVRVVETPSEVTLTLSQEEAEALAVTIYCGVGGDPVGPRGKVQEILRVLESSGAVCGIPDLRERRGWFTRGTFFIDKAGE